MASVHHQISISPFSRGFLCGLHSRAEAIEETYTFLDCTVGFDIDDISDFVGSHVRA